MVDTIDQALITEFSEAVHHEAQQMTSRLKPHVILKQMEGDVFAYDGLGSIEAREAQGRNIKADFDDIDHNRRKISRKRYVVNLPVDSSDVRGALQDPQNEYAKAVAAAMMRQFDRVVIDAAFADVKTGRDFENTVTFASDGGLTVDATAGLTYEKILEINQNFMDNEVGIDMDEALWLTITGDQHTNLMGETELTSGDFTRLFEFEGNGISVANGLKLIKFGAGVANPLFPSVSGERNLIAASNRAFCVGVSKEMSIKVQERNDLIETTQVQAVMEIGAVRTEGELVQKVRVTA